MDNSEEYGNFMIVNTSEESSKDYTLRQFLVSRKDNDQEEQRKIFHFHFLGWPGDCHLIDNVDV